MGNITFTLIVVACGIFLIGVGFYVEIPFGWLASFFFVGAVMFVISGTFHRKIFGKREAKVQRLSGIIIFLIFIIMSEPRGVPIPFSWVKSLLFMGLSFFVIYLIITTD